MKMYCRSLNLFFLLHILPRLKNINIYPLLQLVSGSCAKKAQKSIESGSSPLNFNYLNLTTCLRTCEGCLARQVTATWSLDSRKVDDGSDRFDLTLDTNCKFFYGFHILYFQEVVTLQKKIF